MNEHDSAKKYEPIKIPNRLSTEIGPSVPLAPAGREPSPLGEGMFYEIEYDACPIPGVGKFVLKPQKIEPPETDEVREQFTQMREIARTYRSSLDYSRFFDRRVYHDNAMVFHKQGMFMQDFTDDYTDSTEFSQYFPHYQMMGYEQLRTYFTWRTEVRRGNVANISVSYAFVYIYELLGNIGVADPLDGLERLMFFWRAFREYDNSIDRYIRRWLRDYHVYYELPHSFKVFIEKNDLTDNYPRMTDESDSFELLCSVSKYDIRKSAFFKANEKLAAACSVFVINRLKQICVDNGICFDEAIFRPTKKLAVWTPFKDALFHDWKKQPDRRLVMSESSIFICTKNKWTFSTNITSDSGNQLIGYIFKQTESALRKSVKYKYKLTANINMIIHPVIGRLKAAGLSLETVINEAVAALYREETKIAVTVDRNILSAIRQEALETQEKLIVPEEETSVGANCVRPVADNAVGATIGRPPQTRSEQTAFSDIELGALSAVLNGGSLKLFADEHGIMLEVLADGINEKAMDFIGDNLLDDELELYDDYINQVKELVE